MTGPTAGPSPVDVFLGLLGKVGYLLQQPAVAGKGAQQVISILQYATFLVKQGVSALEGLQQVDGEIAVLVAESRAPTDVEWDAWDARLRTVDSRVARLNEELG